PMNLLQEVMDTCKALIKRVEHLELDKVAQAMEITKLKRRVKKLERGNTVKGRMIDEIDQDADVVLEDDKEVTDAIKDVHVEESAKDQGRIAESQAEIYKIDLDHANKVLSMQEDETEPAEVVTAASTTITAAEVSVPAATTAGSTTITADEVLVHAATTVATLKLTAAPSRRTKGVVIRDPEESSTTASTIIHSEAKSKDKGKGILIVPNEDDDVYTEATLLARKVPVVDYEIINQNNKPYYKIIRVEGTHQLYKFPEFA
nr:hypothetical protein [Tanacetum cinerariifolium]